MEGIIENPVDEPIEVAVIDNILCAEGPSHNSSTALSPEE